MLAYVPFLALPFGVALALAALIVLLGERQARPVKAEHKPKARGKKADNAAAVSPPKPASPAFARPLAGVSLPIAFLIAWLWQRGLPHLETLGDKPSLVVAGGTVAGLLLDALNVAWPLPKWLGRGIVALFALASIAVLADVWGYGYGIGLWHLAPFALVWGCVLTPLVNAAEIREKTPAAHGKRTLALLLLALLGGGVAVVSESAGVPLGTWPGLALLAAGLGFLVIRWPMALPVSWSLVLGGGGAAAGVMETLVHRHPSSPLYLGLAVLLLIPLSAPTAHRLTQKRPALVPLVGGGLALLPVALAAIVATV